MPKFRVGQKVRAIKTMSVGYEREWIGKILTIQKPYLASFPRGEEKQLYEVEEVSWGWWESQLEPARVNEWRGNVKSRRPRKKS